jgi:hypothetical protein
MSVGSGPPKLYWNPKQGVNQTIYIVGRTKCMTAIFHEIEFPAALLKKNTIDQRGTHWTMWLSLTACRCELCGELDIC